MNDLIHHVANVCRVRSAFAQDFSEGVSAKNPALTIGDFGVGRGRSGFGQVEHESCPSRGSMSLGQTRAQLGRCAFGGGLRNRHSLSGRGLYGLLLVQRDCVTQWPKLRLSGGF